MEAARNARDAAIREVARLEASAAATELARLEADGITAKLSPTRVSRKRCSTRCLPRKRARLRSAVAPRGVRMRGAGARAHAEATFRNFQDEGYKAEGPWSDCRFPMHTSKNARTKKFDGHRRVCAQAVRLLTSRKLKTSNRYGGRAGGSHPGCWKCTCKRLLHSRLWSRRWTISRRTWAAPTPANRWDSRTPRPSVGTQTSRTWASHPGQKASRPRRLLQEVRSIRSVRFVGPGSVRSDPGLRQCICSASRLQRRGLHLFGSTWSLYCCLTGFV